MNPERQQAINYLRAPANGLWRWAEDGAVVVWRDGTTVAFREEVVQILKWLAPSGLPSFGAIVFLLAACRGKLPGVEEIIVESKSPLPTGMGKDAVVLMTARKQLRAQLENALNQLRKVSRLPPELNSGVNARCVLAEAVFEPAKAERHVQAEAVLLGMEAPMSDADLCEPTLSPSGQVRQIHIVAESLKLHTAESLILRMQTGLDALPGAVEVTLPTVQRARKLIEELSRDQNVGMVARAARELMAAVRLPRRLGERDQLAIGGVADITNRGPLDRLLLSELAHDDLTLSVRVALNEALYLRREPPMREPPGTLRLLLDSGLRLWGIPRVLATSVALAMVACDKQHSDVRAWRAHGRELRSVDLLTRDGLVQHLAALEVEAHPGEAVAAFAEEASSDEQNQSVLITHRDALDDPDFRRSLSGMKKISGFVATVSRAGRFELHALPLAHRSPLCEADLNLDAIFDEDKGVSPRRKDVDPSLPAIFGIPVFPFLLPVAGKPDWWIKAVDGFTYATLNDRRLVRFGETRWGARVLANDIPAGKTIWMDCVEGAVHLVKAGASQRPARLVTVSGHGETAKVTDILSGENVLAVHRYGEVILVIRRTEVRAYGLSDGRMLGRIANPHHWTNGRFFRGEKAFYFASWDGNQVQFEAVDISATMRRSIALIIDRPGHAEPWLVCHSGEMISTATEQKVKLPFPKGLGLDVTTARLSKDGNQLFVPGAAKNGVLLGIKDEITFDSGPGAAYRFDSAPPLPTWNLHRVIESISILPDGLAFCGRRNRWHKVKLESAGRLRIGELPESDKPHLQKVTFSTRPKPTHHGCALRTAEWPNGDRAFLDSRGLLHFQSKDPSLPEVTLVLSAGEVAGWTSDGFVCGPAFFFESAHTSEPAKVFERLQRILNL